MPEAQCEVLDAHRNVPVLPGTRGGLCPSCCVLWWRLVVVAAPSLLQRQWWWWWWGRRPLGAALSSDAVATTGHPQGRTSPPFLPSSSHVLAG